MCLQNSVENGQSGRGILCHLDTEYHKLSQAKNVCVVNGP